jgi:3-hydroxyacyl-[acyl-carrier-protein] dehydratase
MNELKAAIRAAALTGVEQTEEGAFRALFCFPADFIGFSGHFPGHPVLPAVVQIMTVLTLVEDVSGEPPRLLRLEKAKFQKEIFPDQKVEVCFRTKESKGKGVVEATLSVEKKQAATFLMSFAEKGC